MIIIDICGRPGTAECEGDGEGDKDSGPSQQNLEKRNLRIRAGFKEVIGRKGLLSKNLGAGIKVVSYRKRKAN